MCLRVGIHSVRSPGRKEVNQSPLVGGLCINIHSHMFEGGRPTCWPYDEALRPLSSLFVKAPMGILKALAPRNIELMSRTCEVSQALMSSLKRSKPSKRPLLNSISWILFCGFKFQVTFLQVTCPSNPITCYSTSPSVNPGIS